MNFFYFIGNYMLLSVIDIIASPELKNPGPSYHLQMVTPTCSTLKFIVMLIIFMNFE